MQPILVLLGSNLLGVLAGGVFYLSASWSFDLTEMGLYATAISLQWVAVGLVGTGLSVATVRLSSDHYAAGDHAAAAGVVVLAVSLAASISVLAAGVGFGFGLMSFAPAFLPGGLIALAVLWAGARSVLDCLRSALLARQQYLQASLLMTLSALTGLLWLAVTLLRGPLTLDGLLVAHVLGLGTSALLGLGFLIPRWRAGVCISKKGLGELLHYARWPALSEGTRLLQANLGPPVLMAVAGSNQAGLYSLARYPAYLFEVVAVSLYQYWLPEATRREGHKELAYFLRRQMWLAGLVAFGMLVGAFGCRPLLPLLGSNFAAAAPLFPLNTLDFALFVLVRPIETVYHGLHKPYLELILRVCHLPLLLGLALLLASRFGAAGMVWAQVFSGLLGLGLGAIVVWHLLDLS